MERIRGTFTALSIAAPIMTKFIRTEIQNNNKYNLVFQFENIWEVKLYFQVYCNARKYMNRMPAALDNFPCRKIKLLEPKAANCKSTEIINLQM